MKSFKPLSIKQVKKLITGLNLNQTVSKICGELIGKGLYRDVYVLKQNTKYVVKIERDMTTAQFANATEFRHYIDNREWDFLKDWLAPCELINETGQVMIQQRITHGRRKDYPKYIPYVFTDLKLKNFGWIGDKFVCCDYSFFRMVSNKEMRYAKWWRE